MKAQALRDSSMTSYMVSKKTMEAIGLKKMDGLVDERGFELVGLEVFCC